MSTSAITAEVVANFRRFGLPDPALVPPDAETFNAVLHDALVERTEQERAALPPRVRECHMAVILADLARSGDPSIRALLNQLAPPQDR